MLNMKPQLGNSGMNSLSPRHYGTVDEHTLTGRDFKHTSSRVMENGQNNTFNNSGYGRKYSSTIPVPPESHICFSAWSRL